MILTDRSRYNEVCPRRRYLRYQWLGWGVQPKAQHMPLVTGTAAHAPITGMLAWSIAHDQQEPPEEIVREEIAKALTQYRERVEKAGFLNEPEGHVAYVVAEQGALVEGLTWAFWRYMIPWLLAEFEILGVEVEETYVVGCTCGLGDGIGEPADHEARGAGANAPLADEAESGCSGVVIMTRPDIEVRRRGDGALGVMDLKTSSYDLDQREYEHSVQIALGSLGMERRLGEPVSFYYLLGLIKGKRDYQSAAEREEGALKKQYSPFCYAWHRAASPPFTKEEWRFAYTREKGFGRVPTWEAFISGKPEESSNVEWLVRNMMPEDVIKESLQIVGPHSRPDILMPGVLEQIEHEERRFSDLATWLSYPEGDREPDESLLNYYAPQSWASCYEWKRPCEYLEVCRKQGVAWQDPLGSGRFVRRKPNHELELQQAVADGITWDTEPEEGEL